MAAHLAPAAARLRREASMGRQQAQLLLMGFGIAIAGYAGCGGDETTGGTTSGTAGGDTTSTTSSAMTTTTTGMPATSVTTGPGASGLAMACAADTDCGMGLVCSKASDTEPVFGGGVAGGYCTKSCKVDSDCPGTNS